jgi:hypothetical protein
MGKAVIKKIELDLGGKVVSLTLEQAENLKSALDKLFGEKVVERHYHDNYYDWRIRWPNTRPEPLRPYYTEYTTAGVTWSGGADGTLRLTG